MLWLHSTTGASNRDHKNKPGSIIWVLPPQDVSLEGFKTNINLRELEYLLLHARITLHYYIPTVTNIKSLIALISDTRTPVSPGTCQRQHTPKHACEKHVGVKWADTFHWFTFEKIKERLRDKDVQTVILQRIPWHYHVPLAPKEPSPCTKTHSTVRNHNFTLPATGFIFLSCFHTMGARHMRATVDDTEMPVSYHQSQRK